MIVTEMLGICPQDIEKDSKMDRTFSVLALEGDDMIIVLASNNNVLHYTIMPM